MDKFIGIFEEKLTPIAMKLDSNRYLSAIKNSFMAAMPLLIIGSFFILFANMPIPAYINFMEHILGEGWQRFFTVPNDISMSTGLVPLTNGVNIPWTTPPVISGFLVSGWRGAVLNIVQILVSAAVYYPFFRTADKLAYDTEQENERLEQQQTNTQFAEQGIVEKG